MDLAVEFDQTKEEPGIWFATLMAGGFDHLGALRRELRGNQRTSCYVDERAATSSERAAVPPKRDSDALRARAGGCAPDHHLSVPATGPLNGAL